MVGWVMLWVGCWGGLGGVVGWAVCGGWYVVLGMVGVGWVCCGGGGAGVGWVGCGEVGMLLGRLGGWVGVVGDVVVWWLGGGWVGLGWIVGMVDWVYVVCLGGGEGGGGVGGLGVVLGPGCGGGMIVWDGLVLLGWGVLLVGGGLGGWWEYFEVVGVVWGCVV